MEPKNNNDNKELSHWCSELKKEIFIKSGQKFCKYCGKAVGKPKSSDKIIEIETSEITHLCSYLQKEIQLSSSLNFCKYCGEKLSSEEKVEQKEELEFENVHWCSHYGKEIIVESGLKFCKYCGKSLIKPDLIVEEPKNTVKELELPIKEPFSEPIISNQSKLEMFEETNITYGQTIREEMDRGIKIKQEVIAEKVQYKEKQVKKFIELQPKPYIERKNFRERLNERVEKRAALKTRDKNDEVEVSYFGGILLGLIIGALIGGIWGAIMIGQGVGGIIGGILGLFLFQNRKEKPGESQEKLSENPVVT